MKTEKDSAIRAVWATAWRSFAYLPVGLAASVLVVCLLAALLIPPIIGAVCLYYGLWRQGVIAFFVWGVVVWAWRHFRLKRFFETPPSSL